jgi:hypothetical protein
LWEDQKKKTIKTKYMEIIFSILGYFVRLFYFKVRGKSETFHKRRSTNDDSVNVPEEYSDYLVGWLTFVIGTFLFFFIWFWITGKLGK